MYNTHADNAEIINTYEEICVALKNIKIQRTVC